MSFSVPSEALDRALQCAAAFESDCILSSEIGLAIPAAFVYDNEKGLKMITAPKITEARPDTKLVNFMDPSKQSNPAQARFHTNITVQFYDASTRGVVTDVFLGPDAYCVQILRAAFDDSCWKNID